MNINAKQLIIFDATRLDVTTALSFFGQIKAVMAVDVTLTNAMGDVWTAYTTSLQAYDDAYAQSRKSEQTADIMTLDKSRDNALSAYLNAQKAMLASPNAAKAQAAKKLQFICDKYSLSGSDEYMKATTAIEQMIQETEASAEAMAALTLTGLDDWLTDLKQKNEAFLAKMNERTDDQAGQQKGIVRETRLQVEAAYRNVVKLINAMAICELPAGYDYTPVINRLNAEIEHYRLILARKGTSTGSSTGSSTGTGTGTNANPNANANPNPNPNDNPGTTDNPGTGTTDPGTGTTDPGTGTTDPGTGDTPGDSGTIIDGADEG